MDENSTGADEKYVMEISIPFPSDRYAEIAYNTLRVDKEPRRGRCKKTLTLKENELFVKLETTEARSLRIASNSFLDIVALVTDTMSQFGPPVEVNK